MFFLFVLFLKCHLAHNLNFLIDQINLLLEAAHVTLNSRILHLNHLLHLSKRDSLSKLLSHGLVNRFNLPSSLLARLLRIVLVYYRFEKVLQVFLVRPEVERLPLNDLCLLVTLTQLMQGQLVLQHFLGVSQLFASHHTQIAHQFLQFRRLCQIELILVDVFRIFNTVPHKE